ncbi:MAG: cytochrome b [Betaproteobacteria bacterium]|nr:cytochrome b [Betaproteobacteria bacterium]
MGSPARYHPFAIALHWVIALLVFAQIALGWWMQEIPKSPPGLRAGWFNLHKSIGLTIGMLMLLRLGWRLRHPPPPLPASMPRWQAGTARASHFLLYACLIVQPLWGYLGSSFTSYPIRYFGVALPHWGWDFPALKDLFSALHLGTAYLLMTVLALHVAAALKHLLVDRDQIFNRMWPRGAAPPIGDDRPIASS